MSFDLNCRNISEGYCQITGRPCPYTEIDADECLDFETEYFTDGAGDGWY